MRSKKTLYNIIFSLAFQVIAIICGFIIPKLIITKFGSNVNGVINSITQFLAYITFLESGIGPVVKATLYKPIAKKDKKQIENILNASERFFRVIALIFVVYLVGLTFIYPTIINNEFEFWYTASLILIISIGTFAEYYFGITYTLYLQSEQRTYVTSIMQIVVYIINLLTVIILVKLNCSIQLIKLVSALILIVRPLVQNIYVKKKYKINLKKADKKYKLKQKWDGLAQHIAYVIHSNTDIVILTIFRDMAEVSVYSVYNLIVKGVKSLIQAFSTGVEASFGDMIAKGESEILNKNFKIYELLYYTVITIVYTCTLLLIIPFVKVYTLGITDANYIRPMFGYLIVLAEFIWAIRLPYSSITLSAGHFKETRKGAWIEAVLNVVLSIMFIWKLGIVGVAIGTLIAMLIRTIEFMYHTTKYILDRHIVYTFKRIIIITVEVILVVIICKLIPTIYAINYITLLIKAICIFIVTSIIVIIMNYILYKNEFKMLIDILRSNIFKKSIE